jgi:predicted MPP superfamily phosphohydrolase
MARQGFQVLRNRAVQVGDAGGTFDLVGVDDWSGGRRRGKKGYDLDLALQGHTPDRAAVLLAHQPANFEVAARRGIDLQISGHTHGGQLFPMTMLLGLEWKYTAGLYKQDSSHLYVSRGCGFWGPPMRIGSPPEIVKLVLTA